MAKVKEPDIALAALAAGLAWALTVIGAFLAIGVIERGCV